MNARALERYKKLLLAKRDALTMARGGAGAVVPPSGGPERDIMDYASADSEAEIQIRLQQSDAHLARAVEGALARIRRGTFGICESCKQPILKARLEAVPWTRLCRECKERGQSAA